LTPHDSPWQPTAADLEKARQAYRDSEDRATFALHALSGVEPLVAALESNDWSTARRTVRTMRAFAEVDAEMQRALIRPVSDIFAELRVAIGESVARLEAARAEAA